MFLALMTYMIVKIELSHGMESEIIKLEKKMKQQELYLIPLRFYVKGNKIKLKMGLCKSKKLFDKRQALKERVIKKDIQRQLKARNQY